MKGIFSVVAALPLLLSGALADTLSCRTVLAASSTTLVPTATTTTTTGLPATITKTNQQTIVTSKGLPTTTTLYTQSVTTVTAATVTGTATVTTIRYSASTVRSTLTNTAVVTSTSTTTITSTTLLPTPSGFSPIDSTLNNGALSKRELEGLDNEKRAKKVKTVNARIGLVASQYPAAVFCTQYKSNTATVTTTTVLTATTNTVTFFSTPVRITSVLRETVTDRPVTVTTSTITSVKPIVTSTTFLITSTSTIRATATSIVSGPTAAAVCADASNYFGPNFLNGGDPYYVANALNNGPNVGNSGRIVSLNGMNTQEACCNACQASPQCEGFLYRSGNAGCFLFSHPDSTCSAQSNRANLLLSASGDAPGTSGFVAGNGKCGYFYSANADGSEFPVDAPAQAS